MATKKPVSKPVKPKDPSQRDSLRAFFDNKLTKEHFSVSTKEDADALTNAALDHIQRSPKTHRGVANQMLKETLEKHKFSTTGLFELAKEKIGLHFKVTKPTNAEPPQGIPGQTVQGKSALEQRTGVPSPPTGPGVLPKQDGPINQPIPPQTRVDMTGQEKAMKIFTEAEKKEYEAIFTKGLGFLGNIYKKMGIIKIKEMPEPEILDEAQWDKDVKELAESWADYCIRRGIEIPTWIELFMLVAWSVFTFGAPLINTFMLGEGRGQKKGKEDDKLDDIGEDDS